MQKHLATASRLTLLITVALFAANTRAADLSAEAERLDRALGGDWAFIGTIKPRDAKDIESSNWSIGAETMDRDYTVYANWRKYLGPLGAKKARIQSGWAKTERKQGEYDWAWMDETVLDMVDQGVEPWVCLCYGNPVYPGGGDTGLGGGLVASEEALQAWERYVAAYVERYAKYVDEWELWNEPRTGRGKGTVQYGSFVARTAAVIRKIQPNAEILFAAGGSFDSQFAKEVLDYLKQEDKLDLVDAIIFHPYKYNPDESYGSALALRRTAKSYASHIDIRQGENGAPSKPGSFGAISGNDWTQRTQAKWLLRRLLGDLGRDIPSSYFAICDMRYPTRVNYKGLLAINEAKEVTQVKLGYHAMQHLTALFDNEVQRIKDFEATVTDGATDSSYSVFGYRGPADGLLVTLWRGSDTPDKRPDMERITLTVPGASFDDPVWVDLLTGRVYDIDDDAWSVADGNSIFTGLPVYDSTVVIADRKEVARVAELKEVASSRTPPQPGPVLTASVTIRCDVDLGSVKLAVQDLAGDLEKVLGDSPKMVDGEAQIVIQLDDTLDRPESYRIEIAKDSVRILGADDLGVIYGVYRFCNQFLGVDPYWFFKDLEPEPKHSVALFVGTIASKRPTFRYRGWFVNDEDLLTEWKEGGGRRFIHYPFYSQVTHLEVIDRVFEALLRAGGNVIIPASFVDVMNEPEANLVRRAVERGLYVSQHHIEPLGVSHFGFENYWAVKGENVAFAYGSHPERVREVWRAFAQRWHEIAGDKVVWQLGLRGKADRAIWTSDKTVERAQAGAIISRAIAEQWEIVKSVDARPTPPATTTLWLEGSTLMSEGSLTFPPGITIVFADEGRSQKMQADFHQTRRTSDFGYGAYYHIGFWGTGPHLLQGSTPDRIRTEFSKIVDKGDTNYAIINVCNVREHVLGIQVATELMSDYHGWSQYEFWNRFAPKPLQQPHKTLLANLFPLNSERIMQDGALFAAAKKILSCHAAGRSINEVLPADTQKTRVEQTTAAIAALDELIENYPADELSGRERPFYDTHLLTQSKQWRELYAFYRAIIQTQHEPSQLAEAEAALERFLTVREAAAQGKWENWFRGDKKVNTPELFRRVREVRQIVATRAGE